MSKVLRQLRKSFAGKPVDDVAEGAPSVQTDSPVLDPSPSAPSQDAKLKSPSLDDDKKVEDVKNLPKKSSSRKRGSPHRSSSAERPKKSSSSKKEPADPALKSSGSSAKKSKSSSHSKKSSRGGSGKSKSSSGKAHRESKEASSDKAEKAAAEAAIVEEDTLELDGFDPADSSEEFQADFVGDYDFHEDHSHDSHDHISDFSCLSPEEIIQAQKKAISEVSELLHITASNASNLIRHYQWKTEKLLAAYFDNPDKVIKEAGIIGATGHTHNDEGHRAQLSGVGECLICCDDVDATESCALTCEHRFCHSCWSSYLSLKIKEGEVLRINCPSTNCRITVPDDVIKELVPQDIYDKYLRFVTKSFVEDNDHVTWCPAAGCGNAITADQLHGLVVQCTCGYRFCFSCHDEDHRPVACDQLAQWRRKCSDESETSHWLGANTKDCPKCQVAVEKNGGCMHMTCRQCGYEWCWLCLKIWKGHADYYSCSRFEKASKKAEEKKGKKGKKAKLQALEEEREQKRKALERYLNYYQKYLEFDASAKKAPELLDKARQKMDTLQSEQSTLAEVKFIEKAARVLSECHVALRNSYIYSYYIEDDAGSEKQLFLFLQSELEKTAGTLATSLDAANILKRRTEVVDMTVLAQTKKDNLLKAVEHGVVDTTEYDADMLIEHH